MRSRSKRKHTVKAKPRDGVGQGFKRWNKRRTDDAAEAAWLADQWRLTDADEAYERGGAQEVSEP